MHTSKTSKNILAHLCHLIVYFEIFFSTVIETNFVPIQCVLIFNFSLVFVLINSKTLVVDLNYMFGICWY